MSRFFCSAPLEAERRYDGPLPQALAAGLRAGGGVAAWHRHMRAKGRLMTRLAAQTTGQLAERRRALSASVAGWDERLCLLARRLADCRHQACGLIDALP